MIMTTRTGSCIEIWHRLEGDEAGDIACFSQVDELETPKWALGYSYEIPFSDLREDEPHKDCFRVNNRVSGEDWEYPVRFDSRSLSVGDIVRVEIPEQQGEFITWAVNRSGFATVADEKFYAGAQGLG